MFINSFVFCFNHRRIPTGSFPSNFVKIRLDLAEILRISKLDWRDGGGGKKEGRRRRRGGILLCNGLIYYLTPYSKRSYPIILGILRIKRDIFMLD